LVEIIKITEKVPYEIRITNLYAAQNVLIAYKGSKEKDVKVKVVEVI